MNCHTQGGLIMKNWRFYHGTSSKAYESINTYGLMLTDIRYHNFLAPQGIYLVPNRPLIARRFAKQASRSDFSRPVVLDVKLKLLNSLKILDLTSDTGMNRFYRGYLKAKSLYSIRKAPKLGKNVPDAYKEYIESICDANKQTLKKLEEADNSFKDDPRRFNWDTAAIRLIIDEDDIQIVIAAVQEGTTFNYSFSHREPAFNTVPHYCGIRCRDHIEVCVTDLSIIDLNKIKERPYDQDLKEFEEDFVTWVTNIDAPDAIVR